MSPANRKSGSQYLIGSAKHELLHTFNIHRGLNTPECHRMKRNYYFTFGNNKESSLGFIGIWNVGGYCRALRIGETSGSSPKGHLLRACSRLHLRSGLLA